MLISDWVKEFGGAITVCDDQGIIIEMNDRAIKSFKGNLAGSSLFACHPEAAGLKLRELMDKQQTNVYTIEKNGIKKLIYQAPWYKEAKYQGFMEIVVTIPAEMPHFIRHNE
jgi:hypothetical protein